MKSPKPEPFERVDGRFRNNQGARWGFCTVLLDHPQSTGVEVAIIDRRTGASRTLALAAWQVETKSTGPRGGTTWDSYKPKPRTP